MGVVIRLRPRPGQYAERSTPGRSPRPAGRASSLLNELVFDDAGNLYVTDSFQATIYRVPPGGGAPVGLVHRPPPGGRSRRAFRGERHPHRQERQEALRLGHRRERHAGRRDLPAAPGGHPTAADLRGVPSLPVPRPRPGRAPRTRRHRLRQVGQALRRARGHQPDLRPRARRQRGGALLGPGREPRRLARTRCPGPTRPTSLSTTRTARCW